MIRLVLIWNAVLTVLLAVLLLNNRHDRLDKTPLQAGVPQTDVLRARRVEIVDHEGRLTAVLGRGSGSAAPAAGLTLFDPSGREAVVLALNDRGYGTLYFASKQNLGKVSVGYFTGSDQVAPLSEEDPGGGWGVRVLRPGLEAPQVFGVQGDGRPIPTSR
jgi:hypothetical protein